MNISKDNDNKLKNKLNKYIYDNCICDGMGPLDAFGDTGNFNGLTNNDVSAIVKILNMEDEKLYICNWCGEDQYFKDSELDRKPLQDRMATALFGLCTICKKEHIMHLEEDEK